MFHTVKNPANPARSTERNGISSIRIVVSACLRVGFLNSLNHAETTRTNQPEQKSFRLSS